ncbi:energy transducer TonB [Flavobacteriaceae bacterium 3-367]|uniref:energy transducer TonB n=1 Tax=Eudoraea algarum TaxID=3417568 RepID=UPI003282D2FD
MKPKKNPKADLNRDSGLFFVIGLTVVLFLTWRALEMKTYDKDQQIVEMIQVIDELKNEEAPKTENVKAPPPPPPPAAPEIIEIVEDEAEIEETVIESTETSQDAVIEEPIIDVDDVAVEEEEEEISVPFAVIENVPIFPGCEGGTNEERKTCFQEKIQEHINKNFKYPASALEMGTQGKVFVLFTIDSKGIVSQIKTRGPDRVLEKEAHRIIASLPQMTPGRQRGKNVSVPYSIPINFKML